MLGQPQEVPKRLAALALAIALPSTAFAVGEWDDDPTPAAPEPAPNCMAGEVLDTLSDPDTSEARSYMGLYLAGWGAAWSGH